MIKVTAIQTGTVQIKAAQATGKPGRSDLGRKIDIFRDLEWLPLLGNAAATWSVAAIGAWFIVRLIGLHM